MMQGLKVLLYGLHGPVDINQATFVVFQWLCSGLLYFPGFYSEQTKMMQALRELLYGLNGPMDINQAAFVVSQ